MKSRQCDRHRLAPLWYNMVTNPFKIEKENTSLVFISTYKLIQFFDIGPFLKSILAWHKISIFISITRKILFEGRQNWFQILEVFLDGCVTWKETKFFFNLSCFFFFNLMNKVREMFHTHFWKEEIRQCMEMLNSLQEHM